jgi:hypothetical protein
MLCLAASSTGATWHEDYTSALSAARADRKPLLVVMHNPQRPQQQLEQASHVTGEATTLLENYHVCRIDVSTENGKRVASVFRATSFPYTVITDREAKKIIYRKGGAFTDSQWTETLADYRRGSKPVAMAAFRVPASSFGGPDCPT